MLYLLKHPSRLVRLLHRMANPPVPCPMSSWQQQNGTQKTGSKLFHPDPVSKASTARQESGQESDWNRSCPTKMPFILTWGVANPSSYRGLGPNLDSDPFPLLRQKTGLRKCCDSQRQPHNAPGNQEYLTANGDLQSQGYTKYIVNTKTLLLWF